MKFFLESEGPSLTFVADSYLYFQNIAIEILYAMSANIYQF